MQRVYNLGAMDFIMFCILLPRPDINIIQQLTPSARDMLQRFVGFQ